MTRFAPLWLQEASYPSTLDRGLMAALWPNGGVLGGAVTTVANTMGVSIAPGSVAVPLQTGQGSALCRWDAPEVVTLTAAPPSGQSRIDLLVCQVRDNALDSGANNDFIFAAIAGTPAASAPGTPATPANAYAMSTVLVPGGAANLNGATLGPLSGPLSVTPRPTGRCQLGTAQSIPNNTATLITNMAATALGGGMVLAPSGAGLIVPVGGTYSVKASVNWTASVLSFYLAIIGLNGASAPNARLHSAYVQPNQNFFSYTNMAADDLVLKAGDIVQVLAQQGSGAAQSAAAGAGTSLTVHLAS
jgi:hypothetical protein